MPKVTVIVDTREQRPLLFPDTLMWYSKRSGDGVQYQVVVKRKCLKTADYALEGWEREVLVERKGSLKELHANLFSTDKARSDRSFERLAESTKNPYLLLDMSPSQFWKPNRWANEPARIFDALMYLTTRLNIRVWFSGPCKIHSTRRVLGEQMIRMMMAHAFRNEINENAIEDILRNMPL